MEAYATYCEYECGCPCTPDGCPGHATDIPVSMTINGYTFELMGEKDDLSFLHDKRRLDHWERTVEAILAAAEALPPVEMNMAIPAAPEAEEPGGFLMTEPDQFVAYEGEYEKQWYDVLLPSGEIVFACWPNAGKMVETKEPFRSWQVEDRIRVRPSSDQSVEGILKCLR